MRTVRSVERALAAAPLRFAESHPNTSGGTPRTHDIRPVVAAIRLQAQSGQGDALVASAEGTA
jgi:hypothetical protein